MSQTQLSLLSPMRRAVPATLLEQAPQWGRELIDFLGRTIEELSRGIEAAGAGRVKSKTLTISLPIEATKPLILAEAVDAKALWLGRAQAQKGESVLTAGVRWSPTRGGAKIEEVGLPTGTYLVEVVWL